MNMELDLAAIRRGEVKDLRNANLYGANLTEANLTRANLTEADLTRANFADVNLSMSRGIEWSQAGPIGTDRRTLTGVVIDNEICLFAGCYQGTPDEFSELVEQGGHPEWEWPTDHADLKAEALAALLWITTQLEPKLVAS